MVSNTQGPAHSSSAHPTAYHYRWSSGGFALVSPEVWRDPTLTPFDIGVFTVIVGLLDLAVEQVRPALHAAFPDQHDQIESAIGKLVTRGHIAADEDTP